MTRTFKVKGEDAFGVELERTGDLVLLRTHTPGWPFPAERTLPRADLVWICGDPEPTTAPSEGNTQEV
ncbi:MULTISPECIES: hypothetical protein [Variovorax]|uniref:hypothetical protein n=1 Tax=Variovorax TaxID=34072 RepID=UPI002863C69E|nr:hypothetical protein [Variovorax sp. 3319]MDR6887830.1 hypothetical protein [Variovorax sp. 3319]